MSSMREAYGIAVKISLGVIDGEEFYCNDDATLIWRDEWSKRLFFISHEIDNGEILNYVTTNLQKELTTYLPKYKKALEKARKLMVLL